MNEENSSINAKLTKEINLRIKEIHALRRTTAVSTVFAVLTAISVIISTAMVYYTKELAKESQKANESNTNFQTSILSLIADVKRLEVFQGEVIIKEIYNHDPNESPITIDSKGRFSPEMAKTDRIFCVINYTGNKSVLFTPKIYLNGKLVDVKGNDYFMLNPKSGSTTLDIGLGERSRESSLANSKYQIKFERIWSEE